MTALNDLYALLVDDNGEYAYPHPMAQFILAGAGAAMISEDGGKGVDLLPEINYFLGPDPVEAAEELAEALTEELQRATPELSHEAVYEMLFLGAITQVPGTSDTISERASLYTGDESTPNGVFVKRNPSLEDILSEYADINIPSDYTPIDRALAYIEALCTRDRGYEYEKNNVNTVYGAYKTMDLFFETALMRVHGI